MTTIPHDLVEIERSIHQSMELADAGHHQEAFLRLMYLGEAAEMAGSNECANTAHELAARSLDALGLRRLAKQLRGLALHADGERASAAGTGDPLPDR